MSGLICMYGNMRHSDHKKYISSSRYYGRRSVVAESHHRFSQFVFCFFWLASPDSTVCVSL